MKDMCSSVYHHYVDSLITLMWFEHFGAEQLRDQRTMFGEKLISVSFDRPLCEIH